MEIDNKFYMFIDWLRKGDILSVALRWPIWAISWSLTSKNWSSYSKWSVSEQYWTFIKLCQILPRWRNTYHRSYYVSPSAPHRYNTVECWTYADTWKPECLPHITFISLWLAKAEEQKARKQVKHYKGGNIWLSVRRGPVMEVHLHIFDDHGLLEHREQHEESKARSKVQ